MSENITLKDPEFFKEVYELMINKYPELLEKFGIWRIHQHFELGENEVFHEVSDPIKKESMLRIIPKDNLPNKAFASTWRLTEDGAVVATWCCDDSPTTRPV